MNEARLSLWRRLYNGLNTLRRLVLNVVFVLILGVLALVLLESCRTASVPDNAALVLNPVGVIVDEATLPDPVRNLLTGTSAVVESELQDILDAIEQGANDPAIQILLLRLDQLFYASPAHLYRIGQQVALFKETGKSVLAYGHFYAQHQYYLASFADALYMHPEGQVVLEGYGGNSLYYKDLLDKLKVNMHVFRVGDYKSAVEPFARNDMSEESRMDTEALYQSLWQQVLSDIAANRGQAPAALQDYADKLGQHAAAAGGDLARAALEQDLIDELLTRDQAKVRIADEVGYAANDRAQVNGIDYLSYLQLRPQDAPSTYDQIAVLNLRGVIVNQAVGSDVIALDKTIRLIERARLDPAIKALVVRVDSPGGSQFASELIRQELELLQVSGKPVIASFGSAAASGGYWIAATADKVISEPTTITGSIGIFSYVPTFEKALETVGVHSDGVGTTALTRGLDPFAGLSPAMADVLQQRIEFGYNQFVNLVARGRDMGADEVQQLAQGRVWSGQAALEVGLVDELGGLDLAVEIAAEAAELDSWQVARLTAPVDPRTAMLARLMGNVIAPVQARPASQAKMLQRLLAPLEWLEQFDDPNHVYSVCLACRTH
ncbi:MAG: signal peptide peptidase SppA [Pseudomonadota bacterium]